jgi:hypothetical protein
MEIRRCFNEANWGVGVEVIKMNWFEMVNVDIEISHISMNQRDLAPSPVDGGGLGRGFVKLGITLIRF